MRAVMLVCRTMTPWQGYQGVERGREDGDDGREGEDVREVIGVEDVELPRTLRLVESVVLRPRSALHRYNIGVRSVGNVPAHNELFTDEFGCCTAASSHWTVACARAVFTEGVEAMGDENVKAVMWER